ncbi:DUF4238 domain-containing protein [Candidatus Micrarchaeota archaeon]|nr:DUF4238 domain-containing protein [Candidatus Micrarchaeota archaeon]
MVEYKNQHYVPQFYFRLFSKDNRTINLFNLKNKKIIQNAKISNLCSKDYFYSYDGELEGIFSGLEGQFSSALNKLVQKIDYTNLSSDKKHFVLSFLCFQHRRTLQEREKMVGLCENLIKIVLEKYLKTKGYTKEYAPTPVVDERNLHTFQMLVSLFEPILIGDLAPLFLLNKTENKFIFSDAPVIFHNTFFNKLKNMGTCGCANKGLQIFCPVDPNIMLVLYDPNLYKMQNSYISTIEIFNSRDIDSLNSLQMLSCLDNVFFSNNSLDYIKDLFEYNKNNIIKKEYQYREIKANTRSGRKEVIHHFQPNIPYNLKLSFLKINPIKETPDIRDKKRMAFFGKLINNKINL